MLPFFILLLLAVSSEGIFVVAKPGCVTNKIAPKRLVAGARTLGYFYELFTDDLSDRPARPALNCDEGQNGEGVNDEEEDDNDSGERIGKYYPKFFHNWFNFQPQPPPRPTRPPLRPPASRPPTRPPYHSGGLLVNRPHVTQRPQYPSDAVKPVYEANVDSAPPPWRPGVVGIPSGQVVGARPSRNRQGIIRAFVDLFNKR